MEYLSLVNTSLDLNTNPLPLVENVLNKEAKTNFLELGRKISMEDEKNALVEELNRVKAENKRLTEMLATMCQNYESLKNQLNDYMSNDRVICKKIKFSNKNQIEKGNYNESSSDQSGSDEDFCNIKNEEGKSENINAKISRISVRTETSDATLIVKDGYQWRKYGQKVTRDNPCPRAYFKCSFAPSCPVKKKVQRSREDQTIMTATYEGEHNHPNPSKTDEPTISSTSHSLALGSAHKSASIDPKKFNIIKPTKPNNDTNIKPSRHLATHSPELQQLLVEKMASKLSKDHGFKAALAAAVSEKFYQ